MLQKLAREHLNLNILGNGIWQTCPCCGGSSKFIINDSVTYKCMKHSCSLHKSGNIIHLTMWALDLSYKDAQSKLGLAPQLDRHNNKYTKEFKRLQTNLKESLEALTYIENRYKLTLTDLDSKEYAIGYSNNDKEFIRNYPYLTGKRLIFAIKDEYGYIKSYHTRAIDALVDNRWLPTKSEDKLSFADYIWNQHLYLNSPSIFLTEGISDGLALSKLGLPVVSLLSLNSPSLVKNMRKFNKLKAIVVLLDNDKQPIGSDGLYKSWDCVIPKLLEVYNKNQIDIWCITPQDIVGVKDVNDLLNKYKFNKEEFLAYCKTNAKPIVDFFLSEYKDDYTKHLALINNLAKEDYIKLEDLINSRYNSYLEYFQEVYDQSSIHY